MREIFLVLLGVIADQLWRKFRERKTRLRWSDEFQRLAMAREDDRFGRIEVLYNGDPVRDLHVGQVQIENESNRDLEDVAVNLATSEGGQFLATAGQVQGSLEELPLTDTFVTLAEEFHRTDDDERREQLREHLTTRRDYRIPVLNRGEVAQFGGCGLDS